MPFLRKFAGPLLTVAVAYGVFLGLQRQTPVVGGSAEQAPEVVGLDATLRQALQVGALFTARSLVRSYALGRLFERLGARGFSSSNRVN